LQGSACRTAQFRTCIAIIIAGETKTFEGVCKGEIRSERSGREGFGYDPIFAPTIDGKHDLTFAEMTADQKNEVSHRGQAVRKMVAFLSASV
jgi:XTP/dITP diphosphohydrolase